MNKKELNTQPHITMEKFLKQYLDIQSERIITFLKELSHQEFRELYEELYSLKLNCLPFEIVSKEDVQIGDVLLVLDRYNNPAPYLNPKQMYIEDIMEIERQRTIQSWAEPETIEEYIDTLDNIAFDINIPDSMIKTYSKSRTITRKDDK